MLKLLKYNWKMNSLSVYIMLASTVLLYALLLIGKYKWGWIDEAVFAFGALVTTLSSLAFLVLTCLTMKHQLKSYHRRLLPLSPIEEIASILLLGVIYSLFAVVLAVVYFIVLNANFDDGTIGHTLDLVLKPKPMLSMLLFSVWITIMFLAVMMLAMTATYSIKGKFRAWFGVAIYFGTLIAIDYVSQFILGSSYEQHYSFINFDVGSSDITINEGMPIDWFDFWSFPMLFEVIVLALMITMIQYLLKKRVQL